MEQVDPVYSSEDKATVFAYHLEPVFRCAEGQLQYSLLDCEADFFLAAPWFMNNARIHHDLKLPLLNEHAMPLFKGILERAAGEPAA